ncbi:MAG: hypothetical protein K6E30_02780 [Lachnospiraceae bacterium]|nr:hypothetical protein [Lachnospiraceae bacterium]
MDSIRRKIRSEKGASITFALFLFLVCSMVSIVVLVAATAAGGRLSGISEMDQRYYSVTSAAELFRDAIDGKSVTVTKTKTTKTTESYERTIKNGKVVAPAVTPTPAPTTISNVSYSSKIDGKIISAGTRTSILQDAAIALTNYNMEDNYNVDFGVNPAPENSYKVSVNADSAAVEGILSVGVRETINSDGSLVFIFQNAEEGASRHYKVRLTLEADVKESTARNSESEPLTYTLKDGETDVYTVSQKTTLTETRTTVITWRAVGIEKV